VQINPCLQCYHTKSLKKCMQGQVQENSDKFQRASMGGVGKNL